MPKYRKRPIVIEATRWRKTGDHDAVAPHASASPNPCAHCGAPFCLHAENSVHTHGWIETLEGGHIVCPGDWVITGVQGELYPCKPDIFEATYEAVD